MKCEKIAIVILALVIAVFVCYFVREVLNDPVALYIETQEKL